MEGQPMEGRPVRGERSRTGTRRKKEGTKGEMRAKRAVCGRDGAENETLYKLLRRRIFNQKYVGTAQKHAIPLHPADTFPVKERQK